MTRICLFLLLSVSFFSGCTSSEGSRVADNVNLVKRYFDTFNAHDWQGLGDLYSDSVAIKDPAEGKAMVRRSRSQLVEKYAALGRIFPDLKDKVQSIYPSGDDKVIVEFVSQGMSGDKVPLDLPICTIFIVKAGKICGDYTYYDNSQD